MPDMRAEEKRTVRSGHCPAAGPGPDDGPARDPAQRRRPRIQARAGAWQGLGAARRGLVRCREDDPGAVARGGGQACGGLEPGPDRRPLPQGRHPDGGPGVDMPARPPPTGRPGAGSSFSCGGGAGSRTGRAVAIRAGAASRTARTSPSVRRSWRRRSGSAAGRRTRSSARATAARWRAGGPCVELHASSEGWAEDRGRGRRRAARDAAAARRPGPHDHRGQRQGVRGARLGGAGARGRVPLRDAVPFLGAGPERARERPGAGMLFQGHGLGKVTDTQAGPSRTGRTRVRGSIHVSGQGRIRRFSAVSGDPCPGFPHPVHSPVRIRATVRAGGNPPVAGTRPVH